MRKQLIRTGMQAMLGMLAFLARRPAMSGATRVVTRCLAVLTVKAKSIGRARDTEELGRLWQRSFPATKQVPIEAVTADTVYARIHTPCPLRGSGDVHACHRMMEFDRAVVGHAGGQFVVLASQAEPGRTHCRVAMRLYGADMADLVPAHARFPEPVAGASE